MVGAIFDTHFELCESLKADTNTSHIPIILLTAKVANESKIAGLKRGADAYLTKPINQPELLLSVENALQNRKALKAYYSADFEKNPTKKVNVTKTVPGIDFDIEDVIYKKILAELEINYSNPDYSIDELCSACDMSRQSLNRKLKALLNSSSSTIIKTFRFEKTKTFLIKTNKTISEIAYEAGFKDPSYFTRTFKHNIGVTPTEYRETRAGT